MPTSQKGIKKIPENDIFRYPCDDKLGPTSHNGIAQDWNSWPLGAPRFDSWCGRFILVVDEKLGSPGLSIFAFVKHI